MNRIFLTLSLVIIASLAACTPSMRIAPGVIPPVQPPPSNVASEAEMYVSQHIQQNNQDEIRSGANLKRVKTLVERLTRAAGYPPGTFPVHLVNAGDEVNAAAFNGASIVVYEELLRKVKNDDELATVLGHEVGHIIAKHYTEDDEEKSRKASVGLASTLLGSVANIATSAAGYGGASGLAGSLTETTTGLVGYGAFVGSFNRRQEYEADHLGLLVMAKAGYDPRVAVEFWSRASEVFGSSTSTAGSFFSTHPASADRQKELEKALPAALAFYQPQAEPPAPAPKAAKKKKTV